MTLTDKDKDDIRLMVASAEDTNSLISLAMDAKQQTAFNRELLNRLEFEITQRMGEGTLYKEGDAEVERKAYGYEWDRLVLLGAGLHAFYHEKEPKVEWKFETRKLNTRLAKLDPESEEAQAIEAARTAKYKMEYPDA